MNETIREQLELFLHFLDPTFMSPFFAWSFVFLFGFETTDFLYFKAEGQLWVALYDLNFSNSPEWFGYVDKKKEKW